MRVALVHHPANAFVLPTDRTGPPLLNAARRVSTAGTNRDTTHVVFTPDVDKQVFLRTGLPYLYSSSGFRALLLTWRCTAGSAAGNVVFKTEESVTTTGDTTYDKAFSNAQSTTATPNVTAGVINKTMMFLTSGSPPTAVGTDELWVKITRVGTSGSDTNSGNVELLSADIVVAVDALTEYTIPTGSASLQWDAFASDNAKVTLPNSTKTMGAPTLMQQGNLYTLKVIQGGTGSYTMLWNAAYKFPGGTPPTLSTAVGATDIFQFFCDGTYMYLVHSGAAYA